MTSSVPSIVFGTNLQVDDSSLQQDVSSLELLYQNLLANPASVLIQGGAKYIVLDAGAIGTAEAIQVGNSETSQQQQQNYSILQKIAQFCNANGISVQVDCDLTLGIKNGDGSDALVDQWVVAAAAVGLPITSVEDVEEIGDSQKPANFQMLAAYEANAVQTIISAYQNSSYKMTAANLAVGDMEGGGSDQISNITSWWNAYNQAATAAGLPQFSYLTTDLGFYSPWISATSVTVWQKYLEDLSNLTSARNMALDVMVEGSQTDETNAQTTLQSIRNAVDVLDLQAAGLINASAIIVRSWFTMPTAIAPVNSPTSATFEVTALQAVEEFYLKSYIHDSAIASVSSPGQMLLSSQQVTSLSGLQINVIGSPGGSSDYRVVILIDQTGTLNSQPVGGGVVEQVTPNVLLLSGTESEINRELSSVTVFEPTPGPDALNISVFGSAGMESNSTVELFANGPNDLGDSALSGGATSLWLSAEAMLSSGTLASQGQYLSEEIITWQTASDSATAIKTDTIHLPMAEYGVNQETLVVGGKTLVTVVDMFDPKLDSGGYGTQGYANNQGVNNVTLGPAGWNGNAFDAQEAMTPMIVTKTTNFFDTNGSLETTIDSFQSSTFTTVGLGNASLNNFVTDFKNGGSQVTEYNTGHNPAWNMGWSNLFQSVTMTYDDAGHVVEQSFNGLGVNSALYFDYVFDPTTGLPWELIVGTLPPGELGNTNNYQNGAPYQANFPTGPVYITQFNTGDNPNWNYLDWGTSIPAATELWSNYFIMAAGSGFMTSYPGWTLNELDGYNPEMVAGNTIFAMNLAGNTTIDLNSLSSSTLGGIIESIQASGAISVDAFGSTGTVMLTGLNVGGCVLVGGNTESILNGFGRDTFIVEQGQNTVNTGSGSSLVYLAQPSAQATIIGNNNTIFVNSSASLVLDGDGDVITANESYINITGTGQFTINGSLDTLNYSAVAGLGSDASVVAADNIVIGVASGGTITSVGSCVIINCGATCDVTSNGFGTAIGAQEGSSVSISGYSEAVYGSGLTISQEKTADNISVFGNDDTILASGGINTRISGYDNVVEGDHGTVYLLGNDPSLTAIGNQITIAAVDGATITAIGQYEAVFGSKLNISLLPGSQIYYNGTSTDITAASHDSIAIDGSDNNVYTSSSTVYILSSESVENIIGNYNYICCSDSATIDVNGIGNTVLGDGVSVNILGDTNISFSGKNELFNVDSSPTSIIIEGSDQFSQTNTLCIAGSFNGSGGFRVSGIGQIALTGVGQQDAFDLTRSGMLVVNNEGSDASIHLGSSQQAVVNQAGSVHVIADNVSASAFVSGETDDQTELEITTGGQILLNSGDKDLIVLLDLPSRLSFSTGQFLTVVGSKEGPSTITMGARNQTFEGAFQGDVVTGSESFGDKLAGSLATLNGDCFSGFGGDDAIDIRDLNFSSSVACLYDYSTDNLTVSDGSQSLTIHSIISDSNVNFVASSDNSGGTLIHLQNP
jgi:hypothetical protein